MGSTQTLRTGLIVRYTDPDGHMHDAIIEEIEGDEVFIRYRPRISIRSIIVDISTIRIPS